MHYPKGLWEMLSILPKIIGSQCESPNVNASIRQILQAAYMN